MDKTKKRRAKGLGGLWRPRGEVWWMKYYRNRKVVYESTGTTDKAVALRKLKQRMNTKDRPDFVGPDKTGIAELRDLHLADMRNQGRKPKATIRVRGIWEKHLVPYFGSVRAVGVTTDMLNRYVDKRLSQPGKKTGNKTQMATVKQELAYLKRSFKLRFGTADTEERRFPAIAVSNTRTGFLKDTEYQKLADECGKIGLWMRTIFEIAYTYGWRKGEVNMQVSQVDIDHNVIRLEPGTTKNKQGREVSMTPLVKTLLTACITGKKPADMVFTRPNGKPVKSYRRTWKKVCIAAGVSDLLFHDLRRTGGRNLRRAGVSEGVIMKIGGWKTRSMFDRYNVIDDADMKDAMNKLEARKQAVSATIGEPIGESRVSGIPTSPDAKLQ